MGMGFAREYGTAVASRGRYVYGIVGLVIAIGAFFVTEDVVLAIAVGLAILLVASVLVAHDYFERLAAATLDLAVEAPRGVRVLEPKEKEAAWTLVVGRVRITNRSATSRVSLGIRLIVDMRGGQILLGEEEGQLGKPGEKPAPLHTPLGIGPQDSEFGPVTFLLPSIFAQPFGVELRSTIEGTNPVPTTFRLEIEDHVSRQTVGLPVPGEYPSDD